MYLGLLLIVVVVFTVIGSIFSGGVFTIILVPVAVIAAVAAVGTLIAARMAGVESATLKDPGSQPPGRIRRTGDPLPGDVPATPDDYVRARQQSQ